MRLTANAIDANMADSCTVEGENKLDLKSNAATSERGDKFWNTSAVALKFDVEVNWQKRVRKAKNKPDYGMGLMDSLLEEVVGNKIELAGPLVDYYLRQIGQNFRNKLCRSKATGMIRPSAIAIPWLIFRHILVLIRGYGGNVQTNSKGSKVKHVTIQCMTAAEKLFAPERFSGESVLAYRHFKKLPSEIPGEKQRSVYDGRSAVVVTEHTPLCLDYCTSKEVVNIIFYVQRYTKDDFVIDSTLQALMNK